MSLIPGDPYADHFTGVLHNKFGLRDEGALEAAEYIAASAREHQLLIRRLEGSGPAQPPTFERFKEIHRELFQDVYDWAGQTRAETGLDMSKRSKTTGLISQFSRATDIEQQAAAFDAYLASKNFLQGLPKADFVKEMTQVFQKINEIHPFREGNGRATRVFLQELAHSAGYDFDITKIKKQDWNHAAARSMTQVDHKRPGEKVHGSVLDMRNVFARSMTSQLSHALSVEQRDEAIRQHPELLEVYRRLDKVEAALRRVIPDPEARAKAFDKEQQRILQHLTQNEMIGQKPNLDKLYKSDHLPDSVRDVMAGRNNRVGTLLQQTGVLQMVDDARKVDDTPPAAANPPTVVINPAAPVRPPPPADYDSFSPQ